jgi:serine/threonine-protein kinase RsbW
MPGPPSPQRSGVTRLCLACCLAEVQGTARAARSFLADQGCGDSELIDYELALVEACNNAIEHAGKEGRNRSVVVEIWCNRKEVELRITDHTAGFEWPEQTMLPDSQRESGRGLYLIRALMDYAQYFRGAGENVLVIRKRRR